MNLLKRKDVVVDDYSGELSPLPEDTIKPGMKRTHFPVGKTRRIHVYRPAIMENMRKGKNHPTAVVVDGEQRSYFHAVVFDGKAALKFDSETEDANVYLVTAGKIMGFTDPDGDPPYEFNAKPQPKRTVWDVISWCLERVKTPFRVVGRAPGVNCLTLHAFDHPVFDRKE